MPDIFLNFRSAVRSTIQDGAQWARKWSFCLVVTVGNLPFVARSISRRVFTTGVVKSHSHQTRRIISRRLNIRGRLSFNLIRMTVFSNELCFNGVGNNNLWPLKRKFKCVEYLFLTRLAKSFRDIRIEITIFVFQEEIHPGVFSSSSFSSSSSSSFFHISPLPRGTKKKPRRRGFLPNTKENKGSGILEARGNSVIRLSKISERETVKSRSS